MNLPAWLKDIVDQHGSQRLKGTVTRQEAVTAVRDEIVAKADEPTRLAIYADYAGRALDAWHREHLNPAAPVAVSSLQGELFPDLKPRLFVRPGITKPVMTMNGHDWDNARAMIRNRTEGAIESAEADWQKFEAAYERVRPLLKGHITTADVARELRGEIPLEGLAP